MSQDQTAEPMSNDPLHLTWELRQVLSSPNLPEGDFDPDTLGQDGRNAFYHLAEVLGESRIFASDLDPAINGTMTIKQAIVVAVVVKEAIVSALKKLDALLKADHSTEGDEIDNEQSAIGLCEELVSLVAVSEALTEAYYANAGEDRALVNRLRHERDGCIDGMESLNRQMSIHIKVILPVRRTNLISNWRSMLRKNETGELLGLTFWLLDEELWLQAERSGE